MTGKVELLAPAGNMECFYAAINAGANAVYLAGPKFGARAYADNFTVEELCEAIRYAHLFDAKVYLTLNTLIKQREIDEIVDYVRPFYESGLDGVIVQDLGVIKLLSENFECLELHASTQMTVTGSGAANLLKEYGLTRVVPARELSLAELRKIKNETGLELEIFIHGAMCYCYSGQCLFSSVLGGRSGNRGRCAGPCRLPYEVRENGKKLTQNGKEYPLSLKDLCTIEILPELIDAKMDSFKIEGRMKSPEYVAVVTALYRKYIDKIEKYKDASGKLNKQVFSEYKVETKDLNLLQNLYVRTNLQDGYFYKHNGPELVTLDKPSYASVSDGQLDDYRKQYLSGPKKIAVNMYAVLYEECEAVLTVSLASDESISVTVVGEKISPAKNSPISEEGVCTQLSKTGNTHFYCNEIRCELGSNCFMPNKFLNELRREALEQLTTLLLETKLNHPKLKYNTANKCDVTETRLQPRDIGRYFVVVHTKEQLEVVLNNQQIQTVGISYDLLRDDCISQLKKISEKQLFIVLPRVVRASVEEKIKLCLEKVSEISAVKGVITGSLEGLSYIDLDRFICIADAGLYHFNAQATKFFEMQGIQGVTIPYELNYHESKELVKNSGEQKLFLYPAYGYIPLMETAGCLSKTFHNCSGENHQVIMTDRYQKDFFVVTHCDRCENTIYNSVVMQLGDQIEQITALGCVPRLDFTVETAQKTKEILDYFLYHRELKAFPVKEYTKGYYKRGVE